MKTIYMIRNKTNGLYSKGGYGGGFSKDGKVWASKRNVKLFLTMISETRKYKEIVNNCEMIIIDTENMTKEVIDMKEFVS